MWECKQWLGLAAAFLLDSFKVKIYTIDVQLPELNCLSRFLLCFPKPIFTIPQPSVPSATDQNWVLPLLATCLLTDTGGPKPPQSTSHTNTEAFLGSNEKFKAKEDQTNTNDVLKRFLKHNKVKTISDPLDQEDLPTENYSWSLNLIFLCKGNDFQRIVTKIQFGILKSSSSENSLSWCHFYLNENGTVKNELKLANPHKIASSPLLLLYDFFVWVFLFPPFFLLKL